jgi:protein-S-isoprenylcysteine O-methyltransferase Ste14
LGTSGETKGATISSNHQIADCIKYEIATRNEKYERIEMAALKSLLFLIIAPGLVAGYIPLALLPRGSEIETGTFAYFAFPLWLIGVMILFWCFWDFTFKGRGTPAPTDPPKELVITGLYRYVRNPMYVGVLMIIISHFLWFKTISMIAYSVVVFTAFHLFVTLYEEPHLKRIFGAAYEEYCKQVPRWILKFK